MCDPAVGHVYAYTCSVLQVKCEQGWVQMPAWNEGANEGRQTGARWVGIDILETVSRYV